MMNRIVSSCNSAAAFLYALYLELLSWPFPLWKGAEPFYQLHRLFNTLAWSFADLRDWLDFASDRLQDILTWSNLRGLIRGWLPDLEDVVSWWRGWSSALDRAVVSWWSSARRDVQGWIDAGDRGLQELFEGLQRWTGRLQQTAATFLDMLPSLSEISAWFRAWRGQVLSVVATWWIGAVRDVQGLIDSAFVSREPFWAGWQDVRSDVARLVTAPLDWLEDRFTDWFLGPED